MLAQVAGAIRQWSGGYFEIDHIYGAIHGSSNTLHDSFNGVSSSQLDGRLSMKIYLTPRGEKFYDHLSRMAQDIGPALMMPLAPMGEANKVIGYYHAAGKINPNQINLDKAEMLGLREKWESEFYLFNPAALIGKAVVPVDHFSAQKLLSMLEEGMYFGNLIVKSALFFEKGRKGSEILRIRGDTGSEAHSGQSSLSPGNLLH